MTMRTLAVSIGLFLLGCLVVLAFLLWDESRYRSCLEAGGYPQGSTVSPAESIIRGMDGEKVEECSKVAPF